MPSIGIVEEYWTGVASQLQVEAETFSRLVGHNGEIGRANEIALTRLVGRLIPSKFGVGTGIVIDKYGERSQQCDIIVYDQGSQPQLLAQSTQLMFPIETVRMVIEVKTTLNAEAVADTAEKVSSFRALRSSRTTDAPAFGLFAYQAHGAPSSRAREINALSQDRRPDLTCVLVPGLASHVGERSTVGLVPLHDISSSGERVSRSWIEDSSTSPWVTRGAVRYPVSRFQPSGTRYIFEPGRALLIFASALMKELERVDQVTESWLENYLPEIAQQVVIPE
jgi:hypothetical protein